MSADPIAALALFILADAVGAVPTVRDVLRDPDRERPADGLLCSFGCVLTMTLVSDGGWTLSSHGVAPWAYPICLLGVNFAILIALALGRAIAARNA